MYFVYRLARRYHLKSLKMFLVILLPILAQSTCRCPWLHGHLLESNGIPSGFFCPTICEPAPSVKVDMSVQLVALSSYIWLCLFSRELGGRIPTHGNRLQGHDQPLLWRQAASLCYCKRLPVVLQISNATVLSHSNVSGNQ